MNVGWSDFLFSLRCSDQSKLPTFYVLFHIATTLPCRALSMNPSWPWSLMDTSSVISNLETANTHSPHTGHSWKPGRPHGSSAPCSLCAWLKPVARSYGTLPVVWSIRADHLSAGKYGPDDAKYFSAEADFPVSLSHCNHESVRSRLLSFEPLHSR